MEPDAVAAHHAGYVGLIGRPNVGKSTLLNRLVGTKLAAVTDKPQTTRNRIAGIVTRPEAQIVFVDTPGIHAGRGALNARMVSSARQTLGEADVRVLLIDAAAGVTAADRAVATEVRRAATTIVAVAKTDLVRRPALLPVCEAAAALVPGAEVVPVSARAGDNLETLVSLVTAALPPGPALFPPDQLSDASERFLAAEIVREQVMAQTRAEIPYATAVVIETFREDPARGLIVIDAAVLVQRPSQRGILIGRGGERVRAVGTAARRELESVFGCRVFLELRVKVSRDWSRDPRVLRELGL